MTTKIKTYVKGIYKTPPSLMIWRSYDDKKPYVVAYNSSIGKPYEGFREPSLLFKTQKEARKHLIENYPDSEIWIEKANGEFKLIQEFNTDQ